MKIIIAFIICIAVFISYTLDAKAMPGSCSGFYENYSYAKNDIMEIIKLYSFSANSREINDKDALKLQNLTAQVYLYDKPLFLYEKKDLDALYNFIRPCLKSFNASQIVDEINKINATLKNTFVYLKTTAKLNEVYKENKNEIEEEIKSDILKSSLLQKLKSEADDYYGLKFVGDLCNFNDFILFLEKSYDFENAKIKVDGKYLEIDNDGDIALKLMKVGNKISLGFFNTYEQLFKDDDINPDVFACDLAYKLRLIYAGKIFNQKE